jgi:hypothetical protein
MVLYRTAYTLGIEPFFFSHSDDKMHRKLTMVTKYFVIFGSFILLSVIVFCWSFKLLMIPDSSYWEAMKVVPLIILANFEFILTFLFGTNWLTRRTLSLYFDSGCHHYFSTNFLLIPTMSYYGSAIATIAAYGSMMSIPTIWEQILSHSLRFKENRGYLSLSILFSRILLWFQRTIMWGQFKSCSIFYLSQWKVTLMIKL